MQGPYEKITIFHHYHLSGFILELMQDRAIVTIEGEQETALKLSNNTSLNELE